MELENRQAFQDHTIEELNEVVISQQQQIDRLENLIGRLEKKIVESGGSVSEALGTHGS